MIPKIIHYCWISGEDNMPDDIKACIESWHKFLPDYEFINWNDTNFDWNICEFIKRCREKNLYAFCSDYIRFWALYNYGGIYLDSDVMVYKSFDELLHLKRIITTDYHWQQNRLPESAIIGCEKGDGFIKLCVDWYNNCKLKFFVGDNCNNYVLSTEVMRQEITSYKLKHITNLKEYEYDKPDYITLLDRTHFFGGDCCFAEHKSKHSWYCNVNEKRIDNGNLKIFLCAHKTIENYIPKNKNYVIMDVTGKADNSLNKNFHDVIDISKDEFTKNHNVCYGEGCAMRYLYNHQDLIPEYICFGHYRRMFADFVGFENDMQRLVDTCGALISIPYKFLKTKRPTNRKLMRTHHPRETANVLIECLNEYDKKYENTVKDFLMDDKVHPFNCCVMKKENFIEMCEFCFGVLDLFDKKMGYKNNEDVLNHMKQLSDNKKLVDDRPYWQARLQGFYLEYLTDIYNRYKFKDNFMVSPVCVPLFSIQ